MAQVCIVAARRTPQGRLNGALAALAAKDLAVAAGKAALGRRRPGTNRSRDPRQRARRGAGHERRPAGRPGTGHPRRPSGHDRQHDVRLGHAGGHPRGSVDPCRRVAGGPLRRNGIDVRRAVPARSGAKRLPPRRRHAGRRRAPRRAGRPDDRRAHGPERRATRRALRDRPPRPGRLRPGEPTADGRRLCRRPVPRRTRAAGRAGRRRASATQDHARATRRAAAGVQAGRHGHGGQRLGDQRRRGGAGRLRSRVRPAASVETPGHDRPLRHRRMRAGADGPRTGPRHAASL